MHVVMIAAENAAVPGGKVGGIGDVLRDVPPALASRGHRVSVILPGYQFLSRLPGAMHLNSLSLEFASGLEQVELFELPCPEAGPGVRILLLDHPLFGNGGEGQIYHHDEHEPFARDARTFALFCHAACLAMVTGAVEPADVLHLHDWHAAMVLVLRRYFPAYQSLRKIRTVYSIHNLSLQGIRPLRGSWSSPESWFPAVDLEQPELLDPRYPDCLNLMRAGINLADKVHAVSPTYAAEIQQPSNDRHGQIRGEGLEEDLRRASVQGRLVGILNGCTYDLARSRAVTHKQFIKTANAALNTWAGDRFWIKGTLFHALQRLEDWSQKTRKPPMVVASVSRLTSQKMQLLTIETGGMSALDAMLKELKHGIMILVGSGDEHYERFLLEVMRRNDNFVFLNGFSEKLADVVYRYCDLYLMPSSFEPCGISQMLAMRAGAPCVVHRVGGLADTVQHMVNGFCFEGDGWQQQAEAMQRTFIEALQTQSSKMPMWNSLCKHALETRFSWDDAVAEYERQLYR